jgi:hypothetical protein
MRANYFTPIHLKCHLDYHSCFIEELDMASKCYIFKSFTKYSFNSSHYIHLEKVMVSQSFNLGMKNQTFFKFSFLVILGKCH